MATFDLEEQEQISEIKTWWRMYGNLVSGVVLAVALGAAGWQGWNWYQRKQAAEAVAIYAVVQQAGTTKDAKQAREAAGELTEKYPGTAYAAMAALASAKLQFDAGELKNAKAELQWVADHAAEAEFRDLARLRLAHVLLDEKAGDEALKILGDTSGPLAPRFSELKGDILAAQGKKAEAKAAYQAALAQLDTAEKAAVAQAGRETNYRELLQTKSDSLGEK